MIELELIRKLIPIEIKEKIGDRLCIICRKRNKRPLYKIEAEVISRYYNYNKYCPQCLMFKQGCYYLCNSLKKFEIIKNILTEDKALIIKAVSRV